MTLEEQTIYFEVVKNLKINIEDLNHHISELNKKTGFGFGNKLVMFVALDSAIDSLISKQKENDYTSILKTFIQE